MNGSPALREAAERLRRIAAGERRRIVYGFDDEEMDPFMDRMLENKYIADLKAWADVGLSEHPADSETPIDEAWLRSVGFTRPMTPVSDTCLVAGLWTRTGPEESPAPVGVYPVQFFRSRREKAGMWYVYEHPLPVQPETRSDLRRLCDALGIALKEPGIPLGAGEDRNR